MRMSETIGKIAKALSAFQSQVDGAKKSSDNPFYNSKYADLAEIWKTIREPLTNTGLGLFNGNIEGSLTVVHLAPLEANVREEIKALARDIKAENNQREIWITEETVTLKKLLDNTPAIG